MRFKTKDIKFSPIKDIQREAEERGAVSLAQGIPKFLPPLEVRREAASAIEKGKADFYGPPQGLPLLRKEISSLHLEEEGAYYHPEKEVLITAGALQGLNAALLTLLSSEDELIVPTPSYFPFLNLPKVLGVKPVFVPLQGKKWRFNLEKLKDSITPKTKGILLCHPNNPTGTVYSKEELEGVLRQAKKHNLFVFVDEAYRYFTYPKYMEEKNYPKIGEFKDYKDRVVRLISFSKSFSLSGWRIGYLLASSKVLPEILKVHEMTTTASASLPSQYAALSALSNFPKLPLKFGEVLKGRGERMLSHLENLSSHFEFSHPQGAYYFFARAKGEDDDISLAYRLLREAGVAVVPGSAFGELGKGHIRLSFAAKEGEIDEAFRRMKKFFLKKDIPDKGLEEKVKSATGVVEDSREVEKGDIFVAVPGSNYDGHDFIQEALEKGASFAVGEKTLDIPSYQRVSSSREALARLSCAHFDHPSKKLKVFGITGTDGKTTTSHLLGEILNQAGVPAETLSTLNAPGLHITTPPAPKLQKFLSDSYSRGKKVAVVEVTSHGISQKRVLGTRFSAVGLTNLTKEHLYYHQTFKDYKKTKAQIFKNAPLSVLNRDDPAFGYFSKVSKGKILTYGFSPEARVRAENTKVRERSSEFDLVVGERRKRIFLPLPGKYNIYNALAAFSLAYSLENIPLRAAKIALEGFDSKSLTGRFEEISNPRGVSLVVDFAHTPNALANVLNHAARIKPANSKLIVVFGAAGERDWQKRPKMGEMASKIADFVVLTSEDPRGEDVGEILDDLARGCFSQGAVEGENFVRIPSRRKAIRLALQGAKRGDAVLILGKGHEESMAISGVEYPWSDREVVEEEMRRIF